MAYSLILENQLSVLMKNFRKKFPKPYISVRKLSAICIIPFFFTMVILLKRKGSVVNDARVATVLTCAENNAMDFMRFSEEVLHRDDVYAGLSPLHDTHTYGSKKKLIDFALQKYIALD
uniref:Uncharacterized protein n=1 Tax=Parascaris univalens TaxID=6257 RepID=A0A915C6H5_PARUN